MKAGLANITILASYLETYNIGDRVSFDLSLTRGLDYYSGVIFEVVTKTISRNKAKEETPSLKPRSSSGN